MMCIICGFKIGIDSDGWDGGHNASPINEGKCCEECNDTVVTPMRLRQFQVRRDKDANA